MFLSYENGKGIKTVLKNSKLFVFCGYIAKICIFLIFFPKPIVKIDFFWKFEKFSNFSNFQKQSKFSFFLLFTAMCYDHGEDIKSYFLTSGKPKKQKQSQNNAYITSLKWRSKMTKYCIFVDFFSKPIAKIDTSACKMQIFAM